MNTPNPLVPQGSLEHQTKGKSNIRIAIFTIISIHAVFFAGLLMQGCRRDEGKPGARDTAAMTNELPRLDTNYYASAQELPPGGNASATTPSSTTVIESAAPGAAVPGEVPRGEMKEYTVAPGDSLSKIAKANGITVGALAKANPNAEPAKLRPGQKLQIPMAAAASSSGVGFVEPGKADSGATSGAVYTVKAGENLTRIARVHGVSVKAIKAANHLKTDRVNVGQKLKIPASSTPNTQAASAASAAKTTAVSQLSGPTQVSAATPATLR